MGDLHPGSPPHNKNKLVTSDLSAPLPAWAHIIKPRSRTTGTATETEFEVSEQERKTPPKSKNAKKNEFKTTDSIIGGGLSIEDFLTRRNNPIDKNSDSPGHMTSPPKLKKAYTVVELWKKEKKKKQKANKDNKKKKPLTSPGYLRRIRSSRERRECPAGDQCTKMTSDIHLLEYAHPFFDHLSDEGSSKDKNSSEDERDSKSLGNKSTSLPSIISPQTRTKSSNNDKYSSEDENTFGNKSTSFPTLPLTPQGQIHISKSKTSSSKKSKKKLKKFRKSLRKSKSRDKDTARSEDSLSSERDTSASSFDEDTPAIHSRTTTSTTVNIESDLSDTVVLEIPKRLQKRESLLELRDLLFKANISAEFLEITEPASARSPILGPDSKFKKKSSAPPPLNLNNLDSQPQNPLTRSTKMRMLMRIEKGEVGRFRQILNCSPEEEKEEEATKGKEIIDDWLSHLSIPTSPRSEQTKSDKLAKYTIEELVNDDAQYLRSRTIATSTPISHFFSSGGSKLDVTRRLQGISYLDEILGKSTTERIVPEVPMPVKTKFTIPDLYRKVLTPRTPLTPRSPRNRDSPISPRLRDSPKSPRTSVPLSPRNLLKKAPIPVVSAPSSPLQSNPTNTINVRAIKEHLFREGKLEKDCALHLIEKAKEVLMTEENLLELYDMPLYICGDVHGQFYDLVNIFDVAGDPSNGFKYLFLGDYVDRGLFGCEVCFYLFSLKITYPNQVFLVRGNHESRQMTEYFNFKSEVLHKYDEEVYTAFMEAFDAMPLAALVKGKNSGPFLCCHGGLSPHINTLDDIRQIFRFEEPPEEGGFCDLLWSDPLEDQYELDADEHKEIAFLQNAIRGCSWYYGYKAVKLFLEKNGLKAIIRAHEVQREGFIEHLFKQEEVIDDIENGGMPPVITVFSAPNYCDIYFNKAAFLVIKDNGYEVQQLSWKDHPAHLPNWNSGVGFSLPLISEQVARLYYAVLKRASMEEGDEESRRRLRAKCLRLNKMVTFMGRLRGEAEGINMVKPFSEHVTFDKAMSQFSRALTIDRKNEKRPSPYTKKLWQTL